MTAKRDRTAEAQARGTRPVTFEISLELDELIKAVQAQLTAEQGSCTRTQALERMGREGAKRLLREKK